MQEAPWTTGAPGGQGILMTQPCGRVGDKLPDSTVEEAVVLVAPSTEEGLVGVEGLHPWQWGNGGTAEGGGGGGGGGGGELRVRRQGRLDSLVEVGNALGGSAVAGELAVALLQPVGSISSTESRDG